VPNVTQEQVLAALASVKDPDLHRDIVSLGFVKNLQIEGSRVAFTIELTTPACPVRDQMKQWARDAVLRLPGVSDVQIEMTAQVRTGRAMAGKEAVPGVRNVVAIASGKGGVGKSTVAVNLALALADTGARVGLLDADVTGPNIPLMMAARGEPRGQDGKIVPLESYGIKIISIAFFVPEDQPVIWRGPMVHGAIQQFFRDVLWGELDYLLVDLPPGTGDASLTVAQAVPLAGVVIVTTPQDVALLDVSKSVNMFRRLEVPILGVVENMSFFVCSRCGERADIFGHGGGERFSQRYNIPFLGAIPLHPSIREGGDAGRPIVRTQPDSPQAQAIREVAGQVAARVSTLAYAAEQEAGRPRAVPIRMFGIKR
jgi:ATP-binding protein involved in chromosome partitioning